MYYTTTAFETITYSPSIRQGCASLLAFVGFGAFTYGPYARALFALSALCKGLYTRHTKAAYNIEQAHALLDRRLAYASMQVDHKPIKARRRKNYMEPQPINPPVLPCPVCGAEPHRRTWSQVIGYAGGFTLSSPKQKHKFLYETRAEPLVCTVCGYVQFFVNPEDFRD